MSENNPALGVSPHDFVKTQISKEGGAVTFAYSDRDVIANTVGHISAIPLLHLRFWTPDAIFNTPTKDLAHELADRWKDVPFKGDILVRVGHTSLAGDIQRSLATKDEMKNALPRALRIIGLPGTLVMSTAAKALRMDHYNPLTQTAVTFHSHKEVGMHEIGHAKDFDDHTNWGRVGRLALKVIPFGDLVMEYAASKNALQQMKTDEERRQAIKTLEPAFSTYVMGGIMKLGVKNLVWHGINGMLSKNSRYDDNFSKLQKHTNAINMVLLNAVATIPGLISSRLPNRKSSFGYIFEDTKTIPNDALANDQVRYAQAKTL